MRCRQSLFILLMVFTALIACSGTAKGPLTKREYKVQVGGWQDMGEYSKARDKAMENKHRKEGDIIDCNVVECPEMMKDTP